MRITILNGNPNPADQAFETALTELGANLGERGHAITSFTLRDQHIRGCVGCFGCWVKHPGQCRHKDDHDPLLRSWLDADFALLASPLTMGFYSSLLKTAMDRMLPQLMPYIVLVQGECHHVHRYDRVPRLGLLLAPEPSTDDEDLAMVHRIARGQALNMRTDLAVDWLTTKPMSGLAESIDALAPIDDVSTDTVVKAVSKAA